jgi:protein TonB
MPTSFKARGFLSLFVSIGIHVGVALAMMTIPAELMEKYEVVDLSVQKKPKKPPEPEQTPEEEELEPEPEKPKAAPKKQPKPEPEEEPPPPPPPEEAPEPEKEEAPPVFDLGDNSFAAGDGQGGAWKLQRSEGNTKFAAVAGKNKPSVRGTKAKAPAKTGKPGGKGKKEASAPVPLKDLSQRPQPKNGPPPAPPYPLEARKAGVEGPVVLQVFIDKKGRVRRTRVIKSPSDVLAEAAKSAMAKVLWTPPLDKTGKPVDTVIVWTYRYVLDG